MARRSPAETMNCIRKVVRAWECLAPQTIFDGINLQQCKAAVSASEAVRAEIGDLVERIRSAIRRRNASDVKSMQLLRGVARDVGNDPKFGKDSLLYGAMGYVRNSARGKRRKKRRG